MPNAPDAEDFAAGLARIGALARQAERDPAAITGAIYLTLALDDDRARAEGRLKAFLEGYYAQPAVIMRARQAHYAGPAAGAAKWLTGYARAGADHLVLRFAGDHEPQMEAIAALRSPR